MSRFGVLPHHRVCAQNWTSLWALSTGLLMSYGLLSACRPLVWPGQRRQPFLGSGKQVLLKEALYSCWLEGSQSWTTKRKTCSVLSGFQVSLCTWLMNSSAVHTACVISVMSVRTMLGVIWFSAICEALQHLALAICLPLPFQNR